MVRNNGLNPETAPKHRSIWSSIDRTTFDGYTKALCDKQFVAGRRCYIEPPDRDNEQQYPLSFAIEKSLADDFAFIAASQPQARHVSSATVEQHTKKPSVVVKLAANDGVSSEVKVAFDDIFELLRKHGRKGERYIDTFWQRLASLTPLPFQ